MEGISKSQVSWLCQELDERVERFRTRKLEGPWDRLWLKHMWIFTLILLERDRLTMTTCERPR